MATTIHQNCVRSPCRLPAKIADVLPRRLHEELARAAARFGTIEELRLRRDRPTSVTTPKGNFLLDTVLTSEEIERAVSALCDGSLYAYRDTIARGYVSLPQGIRVGICGRAAVERGEVVGVYDVSGLNIRFPGRLLSVGACVERLLRARSDGRGVLVYAAPGVGKTTLLRSVSARMASGPLPWRVVVIDTRDELGFALQNRPLCLDVLTGYPRALGIEIATRTMNAQLIVCDEIGDDHEAEAIVGAAGGGVPFLASAHAENVGALLRRSGIARLHRARVFGAYVGIRRLGEMGDFSYTVSEWEEADGMV